MAKQAGIIKIEGTVGNLTFVRTKDGYQVKEKTSLNGNRIASEASFQRTRENASEFGRAGKAGKLLRQAFLAAAANAKDSKLVSRLTREMMKVILADATSLRGQRNVIDGESEMLQGFEFNIAAPLSANCKAVYTSVIDRANGKLSNTIQAFVPQRDIVYPSGATHFRVITTGAAIDFEAETFEAQTSTTAELLIDNNTVAPIPMDLTITPASTHPIFLCMGLEFFQKVNGVFYPLYNTATNSLSIVKVEG